jgi:hypothetical protein
MMTSCIVCRPGHLCEACRREREAAIAARLARLAGGATRWPQHERTGTGE